MPKAFLHYKVDHVHGSFSVYSRPNLIHLIQYQSVSSQDFDFTGTGLLCTVLITLFPTLYRDHYNYSLILSLLQTSNSVGGLILLATWGVEEFFLSISKFELMNQFQF